MHTPEEIPGSTLEAKAAETQVEATEQTELRSKDEILEAIEQRAERMADLAVLADEIRQKGSEATPDELTLLQQYDDEWKALKNDNSLGEEWSRWLEMHPEFTPSLEKPVQPTEEEQKEMARRLLYPRQ